MARSTGSAAQRNAETFPPALLRTVGYYGNAADAASEFRRLAEGLDIAVVSVVAARPSVESVRVVMEACRPD